MLQKKGASHVDMILSFVLFVGFIIFIFVVFNPLEPDLESPLDLNIAEKEILENVSINLSKFSVKINDAVYIPNSGETCFYFVSIEQLLSSQPLIMKNDTEGIISTKKQDGNTYFENKGDFYEAYYSEGLEEKILPDISSCFFLSETDYNIGAIGYYDVVSSSRLLGLKDSYNNDYESLKQELGLKKDFFIEIKNGPEIEFVLPINRPSNLEIRAKNIPITIIDKDANLKFDVMNIQVWG